GRRRDTPALPGTQGVVLPTTADASFCETVPASRPPRATFGRDARHPSRRSPRLSSLVLQFRNLEAHHLGGSGSPEVAARYVELPGNPLPAAPFLDRRVRNLVRMGVGFDRRSLSL